MLAAGETALGAGTPRSSLPWRVPGLTRVRAWSRAHEGMSLPNPFSRVWFRCTAQQIETVAMSVICSQNQRGTKAFGYHERVMAASVRSVSLELCQFCFNVATLDIRNTAQVVYRANPGSSSSFSFFNRYTKPVPKAVVSPESNMHAHLQIHFFNLMK